MSTGAVQRNATFHPLDFKSETAKSPSVAQLCSELNVKFISFGTDQRAKAVLALWQPERTHEATLILPAVNLLIALSGGDDLHNSIRFSLALEITFHFIDDLGLSGASRDKLSEVLNTADRDYHSIGNEVCKIVEDSLESSQPPVAEEISDHTDAAHYTFPSHHQAQMLSSETGMTLVAAESVAPVDHPKQKKSVVRNAPFKRENEQRAETQIEQPSLWSPRQRTLRKSVKTRMSRAVKSVRNGLHSVAAAASERLSSSARFIQTKTGSIAHSIEDAAHNLSPVESLGSTVQELSEPSLGNRMKKTFSGLSKQIRGGWSSARETLGETGRHVKSSLRTAASFVKDKMDVWGQKTREQMMDGLETARETLNGKTTARLRSSVSRIGERVAEAAKVASGGMVRAVKATAGAVTTASAVVAHSVAAGAKAAGKFVSGGAARLGNRVSALRGFDRV